MGIEPKDIDERISEIYELEDTIKTRSPPQGDPLIAKYNEEIDSVDHFLSSLSSRNIMNYCRYKDEKIKEFEGKIRDLKAIINELKNDSKKYKEAAETKRTIKLAENSG